MSVKSVIIPSSQNIILFNKLIQSNSRAKCWTAFKLACDQNHDSLLQQLCHATYKKDPYIAYAAAEKFEDKSLSDQTCTAIAKRVFNESMQKNELEVAYGAADRIPDESKRQLFFSQLFDRAIKSGERALALKILEGKKLSYEAINQRCFIVLDLCLSQKKPLLAAQLLRSVKGEDAPKMAAALKEHLEPVFQRAIADGCEEKFDQFVDLIYLLENDDNLFVDVMALLLHLKHPKLALPYYFRIKNDKVKKNNCCDSLIAHIHRQIMLQAVGSDKENCLSTDPATFQNVETGKELLHRSQSFSSQEELEHVVTYLNYLPPASADRLEEGIDFLNKLLSSRPKGSFDPFPILLTQIRWVFSLNIPFYNKEMTHITLRQVKKFADQGKYKEVLSWLRSLKPDAKNDIEVLKITKRLSQGKEVGAALETLLFVVTPSLRDPRLNHLVSQASDRELIAFYNSPGLARLETHFETPMQRAMEINEASKFRDTITKELVRRYLLSGDYEKAFDGIKNLKPHDRLESVEIALQEVPGEKVKSFLQILPADNVRLGFLNAFLLHFNAEGKEHLVHDLLSEFAEPMRGVYLETQVLSLIEKGRYIEAESLMSLKGYENVRDKILFASASLCMLQKRFVEAISYAEKMNPIAEKTKMFEMIGHQLEISCDKEEPASLFGMISAVKAPVSQLFFYSKVVPGYLKMGKNAEAFAFVALVKNNEHKQECYHMILDFLIEKTEHDSFKFDSELRVRTPLVQILNEELAILRGVIDDHAPIEEMQFDELARDLLALSQARSSLKMDFLKNTVQNIYKRRTALYTKLIDECLKSHHYEGALELAQILSDQNLAGANRAFNTIGRALISHPSESFSVEKCLEKMQMGRDRSELGFLYVKSLCEQKNINKALQVAEKIDTHVFRQKAYYEIVSYYLIENKPLTATKYLNFLHPIEKARAETTIKRLKSIGQLEDKSAHQAVKILTIAAEKENHPPIPHTVKALAALFSPPKSPRKVPLQPKSPADQVAAIRPEGLFSPSLKERSPSRGSSPLPGKRPLRGRDI